MSTDDSAGAARSADYAATCTDSQSFELDGVEFSWWAVGDSPAYVTVSSNWFGNTSAFSKADPEATARLLAARIVERYEAQVERLRAERLRAERASVDDDTSTGLRIENLTLR